MPEDTGVIRKFESGATRDTAQNKLDWEGFISPFALEMFAKYMHQHRLQADGSLRDSDNWQKGLPNDVLMKSAWRHFFAWWKIHRGGEVFDERDGHSVSMTEALCGLIFNAMARLHDITKPQATRALAAPPMPLADVPPPYLWAEEIEEESRLTFGGHTKEQCDKLAETVREANAPQWPPQALPQTE